MKIEIEKIRDQEAMHLRITIPNGECYNFNVPIDKNNDSCEEKYSHIYSREVREKFHIMIDEYVFLQNECPSAHEFYEKLVCQQCGLIEDL